MLTQNSSALLASQSTVIANPIAAPTDTILTGLGNSNTALSGTISLVNTNPIATTLDSNLLVTPIVSPYWLSSDDTMATATNLGSLGTVTRTGSVGYSDIFGNTDTVDFYQVNGGGNFNLTLTGLNADVDVDLIRDINGNGAVDAGEIIASSRRGGSSDESIHLDGTAYGSYFVRVQQYSGSSNYTLRLSNSDPNNLLSGEDSFGDLSSYSYRDRSSRISSTDTSNLYSFSLNSARDVTLALTGLSADADIRLIQDSNNNGIVDFGEVLASSTRGGSANEAINKVLGAGNYFAQVIQYSGDTNYNFRLLSTAPEVNLTVNQVNAIDNPDSGWFGDNADYYSRISIGSSTTTTGVISNSNNIAPNWKHNAAATGQYTNLAVEMWDSDGGLAGADDRVDIDSSAGFRDLNITYDVVNNSVSGDVSGSGGSMLTVNGGGDSDRAQLRFTVKEGDWYDNNLSDFYLTHLTRAFAADGSLSRSDMMTLLRESEDNGGVDATELTDLRRIQSSMSGWMTEAVSNLTNKVVNSDAANSRSGIGNLFAGSSSGQMESLIGKWFMGTDRPDAISYNRTTSYSYSYAGGSLFQGGISYRDVDQNNVGDCYFLAGLGAAARQSPSIISSMFTDNGDDTFTVRFFKPDGSRDYVTVDRFLPTSSWGGAVFAGWGGGDVSEANNELWVALAEKAYAQINESGWIGQDNTNSYNGTSLSATPVRDNGGGINGGGASIALQQITGHAVTNESVTDNFLWWRVSDDADEILAAFNSGKMVTLDTDDAPSASIVDNHVYTLVGYNASTDTFQLWNPHGSEIFLTRSALLDNFANWQSA
jgi:Calpain family cysteine protease